MHLQSFPGHSIPSKYIFSRLLFSCCLNKVPKCWNESKYRPRFVVMESNKCSIEKNIERCASKQSIIFHTLSRLGWMENVDYPHRGIYQTIRYALKVTNFDRNSKEKLIWMPINCALRCFLYNFFFGFVLFSVTFFRCRKSHCNSTNSRLSIS